jgi:hypothetical protein
VEPGIYSALPCSALLQVPTTSLDARLVMAKGTKIVYRVRCALYEESGQRSALWLWLLITQAGEVLYVGLSRVMGVSPI